MSQEIYFGERESQRIEQIVVTIEQLTESVNILNKNLKRFGEKVERLNLDLSEIKETEIVLTESCHHDWKSISCHNDTVEICAICGLEKTE